MPSPPLVSIGLPVYNGGAHLRAALDSLLSQDYANLELVISDNASNDETREICEEYAAREPRIRYFRNDTNLGAIKNFNRVAQLARGGYFAWASDHDRREPGNVSRCVEVMEADPTVVLCCPQTQWLEADDRPGQVITPRLDTRGLDRVSRFHSVLWGLDYCYQVYGLIRRETLMQTGLFRDCVGPDNVLLAELALLGAFAFVPQTLFYVRRTPDYGSWKRYLGKLNKKLSPWAAPGLYLGMVNQHLKIVYRHVPRFIGKAMLTDSVLSCMFIKYRWILQGMLRQSLGRGE